MVGIVRPDLIKLKGNSTLVPFGSDFYSFGHHFLLNGQNYKRHTSIILIQINYWYLRAWLQKTAEHETQEVKKQVETTTKQR